MRTREALVLLALAGCGRIAFDGRSPDAAVDAPGHDEDLDGLVDGADNCPDVFNPGQDNADGDGVGDACDPSAATNDQIELFDPFLGATGWTSMGNATPVAIGDALEADTDNSELILTKPFFTATDYITLHAEILEIRGGANRQVYVAVRENDMSFFYCELLERPASAEKFGLVHTPDNNIFTTLDTGSLTVPFETRSFTLTLKGPSTSAGCTTSWPVDKPTLAGAAPALTAGFVTLYAQSLLVRFTSVLVIRSS